MIKRNSIKKIGTLLMALIMTLALATTVFAGGGPATGGLPDPDYNQGSITVHKFAAPGESSITGDGTVIADTSAFGDPLPGAVFTLYRVPNDTALTVDSDPETYAVDANIVEALTTDASGIADFTGLLTGVYVLKETSTPAGYTGAATNFINLPFGIPAEGSTDWNYNVHVYPKNVNSQPIRKTLENDEGIAGTYNVGDVLNWRIDSKINGTLHNATATPTHGKFVVSDPLDNRLTYNPTNANMVVTLMGGDGTLVLESTDYTVAPTTAGEGVEVTVTLTAAGMEKATAQRSTAVRVEFDTTINSNAIGATPANTTSITNGASVTQHEAGQTDTDDDKKETPDDEKPAAQLARVELLKREWKKDREPTDPEIFLNGAKFKIATSLDNAKNRIFVQDVNGADIELTTAGVVVGKNPDDNTDIIQDGWGAFTGLPLNDTGATTFYLVETEAPTRTVTEGDVTTTIEYIRSQSAWEVTFAADTKVANITLDNQRVDDEEGPMPETNPTFKLPKTGGIGTILFSIIGIVLMAAAVVVLVKSRKKQKA